MPKLGMAVAAFLALAAPLTAPLAATAHPAGGSSDDTACVVVRYGDLNLATQEGARTLRDRVDHAAMLVVGSVDPLDLQRFAEQRRARAAALETANAIIAAARSGSTYAANGGATKILRL